MERPPVGAVRAAPGMGRAAGFEIFLAAAPGLEEVLRDEVRLKGFKQPATVPGGVVTRGSWPEVWRANLWLRGTGRVLARVAQFPAPHLSLLESRARQVDWGSVLRADVAFRVEASCARSRVYHSGAAAERVATAIKAVLGAPEAEDAPVTVFVRIERDECTVSVDTSGENLHRRGYKATVNAAPLRETLAALFLRQCGFTGAEPVLDPMCGSGTFVIEAAAIAARLNPGRQRAFAFERLATFDLAEWARMRGVDGSRPPSVRFEGLDRDAAAVTMSAENAARAGVADWTRFAQAPISALERPDGPPGLVITNPPYGARLSANRPLEPLYGTLGNVLRERFAGWRVGIVTTEARLAYATGLALEPAGPPVPHGGKRVSLFRSGVLG